MFKLYFTVTILLVCAFSNAQNNSIVNRELTLKVRPIKLVNYEFCNKADLLNDAIVVEFDVVDEIDKKKFGKKIYAIGICDYILCNESRYSKIWDLTISEIQPHNWKIKILNEKLLNKNRNKEKYWIVDLSREIITY